MWNCKGVHGQQTRCRTTLHSTMRSHHRTRRRRAPRPTLTISAELAGSLAGLSPSQRLKAAREMADRLAVVLAAIERGEIDASATETARLQGAAVALATLTG